MFDELVSDASDAALVDVITDSVRDEASAAARRFAAIAELTDRRCAEELAEEREYWACDAWDCVAAEIAAAQMISHRAASTLMHQALALRHRLPKVGALLAAGAITAPMAALACWRTRLVDQPDVTAAIDADLADTIVAWGRLSQARLEIAVDGIIDSRDPAAVLAYRAAARSRDIQLGKQDDTTGTTSLWGRLQATDGELLTRRLEAMAKSVCPDDPRAMGERRSDALGILAAGGDVLPCRCEQPECPNTGTDARANSVVIHVLTDQHPDDPTGPSAPTPAGTDPPPAITCPTGTAVIAGGAVIPSALLAELRRMGAVVKPVPDLAALGALGAESGYRPSTLLQRFVRARDMTCCQPGCDRPAEYCDLDHSIPYGRGPTHPGNMKCLCRKHHLLKTFWAGTGGWHEEQLPDGTILWTAPTGHRYRTPPGSRLHFPRWDTNTPAPSTAPATSTSGSSDRGLSMPLRKRTRAQQRALAISSERARNIRLIEGNPPPF
jgi:hypothetical protein